MQTGNCRVKDLVQLQGRMCHDVSYLLYNGQRHHFKPKKIFLIRPDPLQAALQSAEVDRMGDNIHIGTVVAFKKP